MKKIIVLFAAFFIVNVSAASPNNNTKTNITIKFDNTTMCLYQGKIYSLGAKVYLNDFTRQTCEYDSSDKVTHWVI